MKKITSLLICAHIILTSMCISASATNTETKEYSYNGIEYTVEFEDSEISEETKENIAYSLIGNDESDIMPANILCTIFGHDYKETMASVIQHKASATSPRCRKQTFDVTYCDDCDYTKSTLLGTTYINCCPED